VEHIFMDRYAVSNAEFQEFVDAGGYEKPELWAEEIRDSLFSFLDRSQRPGPRYWRNGKFLPGSAEHPVVGVSWYEADAYARWAGKRLPSDAEWVKTAVSPRASIVSPEQLTRYPWGNAFRDDRANLWSAGKSQTVAVSEYPGGQTSEGIHQMIGNVWEWTADLLAHSFQRGELTGAATSFKALRGGAFDTYVESQAACNACSGESPLSRRDNVGFRCTLAAADIAECMIHDA
jgi:iron(II)-dependent oxidoreductase